LLRRSEYRYDERSAATGLNAIFTPKNCVREGKKIFQGEILADRVAMTLTVPLLIRLGFYVSFAILTAFLAPEGARTDSNIF